MPTDTEHVRLSGQTGSGWLAVNTTRLTQSGPPPQRQHHGARGCISASLPEPRRKRHLLIPIAYHRHYGRAVWIDPVVLRAITISWNNIRIPVRPYHEH